MSTTQRSYIKAVPQVVSDAMKQLETKITCAAGHGELIGKLFIKMEPTSGLEPLTCRLRISARTEESSAVVDNVGFR
jgi:hypothetical protein